MWHEKGRTFVTSHRGCLQQQRQWVADLDRDGGRWRSFVRLFLEAEEVDKQKKYFKWLNDFQKIFISSVIPPLLSAPLEK